MIKYENLLEGLAELLNELGIPFQGKLNVWAKASHRNDRRPYQEVFSHKHRKIIEKVFQKEIEMHNYTFD